MTYRIHELERLFLNYNPEKEKQKNVLLVC